MDHITVKAGDVISVFYRDKQNNPSAVDNSQAKTFHGTEEPIVEEGNPKREKTLLKIIGALLSMKYSGSKYEINGRVNRSAMERQFNLDLANAGFNDNGIKEGTLRKKVIKDALEEIEENRLPNKD